MDAVAQRRELFERAATEANTHVDDGTGFCVVCDGHWPCGYRYWMVRAEFVNTKEVQQ